MSEETKVWKYKVEDIFEDIPEDPENCLMKIPEEIANQIGLVPGDKLKVYLGDQGTIIFKKLEEKESNGEE